MNIISVDLPWKGKSKQGRVLAIADLDKNMTILPVSDDAEMLNMIEENVEPGSLILLDIPIDGCENPDCKHFRPVDKALAHQGIWIQPSSRAGKRGKKLAELMLTELVRKKGSQIHEIYPYAIYKFLAYLESKGSLPSLKARDFDVLLNESFRGFRPRKYKRERDKLKRVENMIYLHSLLTGSNLGLRFSAPLGYPDSSYSWTKLNNLNDEYDACLGAIAGLYFAHDSRYACLAGDSNSGGILLLADRWLSGQLEQEVPIGKPGKGV